MHADTLRCRILPRIRMVRRPEGAHFVSSATGYRFTPLGYNFSRQTPTPAGPAISTFSPGYYNANAVEWMFQGLEEYGFNTVRVFLWPGDARVIDVLGIGGPKTHEKLYRPYLDNVIHFLRRAGAYHIRVVLVAALVPENDYYSAIGKPADARWNSTNQYYMEPKNLAAKIQYLTDLVTALRAVDEGALLPTVFAYELENEATLATDSYPFSEPGIVGPLSDGKHYDMSSDAERQQAIDANIVHWANCCCDAIRAVDAQAMVSISMYTMQAIGLDVPNGVHTHAGQWPQNTRYPILPAHLAAYSSLSYVDLHLYGGSSSRQTTQDWLARQLNSSLVPDTPLDRMPIIAGEFAAPKSVNPTVVEGGNATRELRRALFVSRFSGALFWTWDSPSTDLWSSAIENNGAINFALIPRITLVD